MSSARASASFWRWASDSREAPTPVCACRPTSITRVSQAEVGQHLADQLADPLGRLGLTVGDLAEQDVVLQARRRGVALGLEERDRVLELGRQLLAEAPARLEHPLLQRLLDQAEAMARRDQLEGQRHQPLAIGRAQRVEPAGAGARRPAPGTPADRRR